jgi:hypothetical protein
LALFTRACALILFTGVIDSASLACHCFYKL